MFNNGSGAAVPRSRRRAAQKTFCAQIFVDIGPVDTVSASRDLPPPSPRLRCRKQAWVPSDRHGDAAPIHQIDRQPVFPNMNSADPDIRRYLSRSKACHLSNKTAGDCFTRSTTSELTWRKPYVSRDTDGHQPQFHRRSGLVDMNVRWFIRFVAIKIQAIPRMRWMVGIPASADWTIPPLPGAAAPAASAAAACGRRWFRRAAGAASDGARRGTARPRRSSRARRGR